MAESPRQQQLMINRDVALLVHRRFRAEIFTVENINRAGFTTNQFMNHMHALTRIKDVNILVHVLELGSENSRFWVSPETCELGQLVRFVGWLKTLEGRNASMTRGMRGAVQSLEKILRTPYN
ncbi:hypothetical protein L195_g050249 [Trifolium pratense]|uniref:Uncharacterized protein n=1 Tax=Trifolium pratense TaxID=57577 RepID=A0A2K3JT01_TRIPR|nr:hypothetical protein L195_g050249 [Trifolium pratense]